MLTCLHAGAGEQQRFPVPSAREAEPTACPGMWEMKWRCLRTELFMAGDWEKCCCSRTPPFVTSDSDIPSITGILLALGKNCKSGPLQTWLTVTGLLPGQCIPPVIPSSPKFSEQSPAFQGSHPSDVPDLQTALLLIFLPMTLTGIISALLLELCFCIGAWQLLSDMKAAGTMEFTRSQCSRQHLRGKEMVIATSWLNF
ncbi:hypothetical protein EK904_014019 [Melospiza melodia maxima]|nr:hypothetical protein EK904_014019 [Melospiza melodia maxima]